jgi:hypothetical protein
MRFYAFTNFYLSSLQQGIQTQHCTADMFAHYETFKHTDEHVAIARELLLDWAIIHKTTIILNGGNSADLESLYQQLLPLAVDQDLPYQKFHEDEQSLNRALTCVGIVLPEPIYTVAAALRERDTDISINEQTTKIIRGKSGETFIIDTAAFRIAEIIGQYQLAR